MFSPRDLLDLKETPHASIFEGVENVWEVLPRIADYLQNHLKPANRGQMLGQCFVGNRVYIGAGTTIEPGALIKGPAWIGENCEIRAGAYVRENVIAGNGCILGNSCEFKNSILFNNCQVPHFSYVGDSVLGARVHLGAGAILSNLKLNNDLISIQHQGGVWPTGLRKFGAILGDEVEIGCNAVVNPGSVLGRSCLVYPGVVWRGVLEEASVVKSVVTQQIVQRRSRAKERSSAAV